MVRVRVRVFVRVRVYVKVSVRLRVSVRVRVSYDCPDFDNDSLKVADADKGYTSGPKEKEQLC